MPAIRRNVATLGLPWGSVIDTATHTVVNTVSNASQQFGLAFTPDGSLVYGTNSNGGTVSVIDAATPNPHRNQPRHPWPSGLNANLAWLTATVMGSTQLTRTPLPRRHPLQPHRRGARPTSPHSANVAVMPNQIVVAGALISGASLLVAQRTRPSELAGLWELPGGKVAAGESDAVALARELHEELDVEVTVGARLGVDVALNPTTTLRAYRVTQTGGTPHPNDHRALRWITFGELDGLAWVPADRTWLPNSSKHWRISRHASRRGTPSPPFCLRSRTSWAVHAAHRAAVERPRPTEQLRAISFRPLNG